MSLAYLNLGKKPTTFNKVREAESDVANDKKLKDEDFAYFARKYKKFLKNNNQSSERYKSESNISRKEKHEKNNTRDSWKKSTRCHDCLGASHFKSECPTYKKT